MNRNRMMICLGLAMAAMMPLTSCTGNSDKDKARREYVSGLNDSIQALKSEIDSCNAQISILQEQQDVWLRDFTTVSNSREAAPYMIFNGFQDKYPPTSTGLIARLAENGQFELIASLKGARFDRITVTSDSESATSDVVPADQALNYTADGLTTVLFTGTRADSIGRLIADNDLNNIRVVYLNGNPVSTWSLPVSYRNMIMASFQLYDAQRTIGRLERRVPLLNRKIDLLRVHQDRHKPDSTLSDK